MSLQIPLRTSSSADTYVRNREWRGAKLSGCPLHPLGGCSFARHGSYGRVTPRGLRIARWYCPEGHRTFSLLPDFLAARLPGLLVSVEDSVAVASSAKSIEAAADALRGPDVTLPSAVRWLRRRVQAVRAALDAVTRAAPPETLIGALVRNPTPWLDSGQGHVLLGLRRSLSPQTLCSIPAPLGFQISRRAGWGRRNNQHGFGPDGVLATHYRVGADRSHAPCNSNSIKPPP